MTTQEKISQIFTASIRVEMLKKSIVHDKLRIAAKRKEIKELKKANSL